MLALARGCGCSWVEDGGLRRIAGERVASRPRAVTVDLDVPPAQRWLFLKGDPYFASYKRDLTNYVSTYIPDALLPLVASIVRQLRSAFSPEHAEEMQGLAEALGVSLGDVVLVNLIYQVENIGVKCPLRNTTGPCPPKEKEGPGMCTGVVADDGKQVWHGRNLDWNLDSSLLRYVLHADFRSSNNTVFSGVLMAGQVGVLHGVRPGGFSIQMNARDLGGSVIENIGSILLGHKTPGTVVRQALENATSFSDAVAALGSEKLANPVYFVIGGARHGEGAIITRDRLKAADIWPLYKSAARDKTHLNPQPDWLRLQTNYDNWESVPSFDDRRTPGVKNAKLFCNATVGPSCVNKVMTTWPTKNHHTDITSIMCAATGDMTTVVWVDPPSARRPLQASAGVDDSISAILV